MAVKTAKSCKYAGQVARTKGPFLVHGFNGIMPAFRRLNAAQSDGAARAQASSGVAAHVWRGVLRTGMPAEGVMSAGPRTRNQHALAAPRVKPPKLLYIYFLLAAFDLVTVSAGLYLNHRIMGIYLRSVEVNRVWADRISAYSHLGELAGAVNAPGNDVFNTRQVEQELARMENAD